MTIVGEPENTLKTNGYSSGWYKVLFVDQQKNFTGHVWGGLLSLGAVQFEDEDGQALFVAGVTGAAEGRFAGEARIIEGGEISAKLPFTWISTSMGEETNYSYSITIEELPWPGVPDLKRLFQVNCNYEACGYTRGNLLFFWDGKNLIAGPSAEGVSEAGVFSVNSEFIFPGQEGLKPGELMVRTVTIESADPESSTPASARKRETLYVWNGKAWSGQEPVETTIPVPSPPAMDAEGAENAADDQNGDANNADDEGNEGDEGQ